MDPTAIIYCSITLQIISAFLAIRLSLISGRRTVGLIILTALSLMAFRRIITFGDATKMNLLSELIALVVSFIFLIGVVYIARLIKSHEETAETLWESQEVLETIIETAPT